MAEKQCNLVKNGGGMNFSSNEQSMGVITINGTQKEWFRRVIQFNPTVDKTWTNIVAFDMSNIDIFRDSMTTIWHDNELMTGHNNGYSQNVSTGEAQIYRGVITRVYNGYLQYFSTANSVGYPAKTTIILDYTK